MTQLLTLHLGPDTVVLAFKVRFRDGSTLSDVERIIDEMEEAVRGILPSAKRIFVEPDSDYDRARDPALAVPS